MSFGTDHAPLIVLSNSIYAKRSDGNFYPGSIEAKYDDCYTVKFADGARESVREENLTWLGFWGLPPWQWPKSPVIQPVVSSWEAFESQTMFVRESGQSKDHNPVSMSQQHAREQSRPYSSRAAVWEAASARSTSPSTSDQCLDKNDELPSHLLPKQADSSQPRSSVLRINSNALTKDHAGEVFRALRIPYNASEDEQRPKRSPSPPVQKERETDIETLHKVSSNETPYSRSSTTLDYREHERYSEKAMYRYFLERRRSVSERGLGWSPEDDDSRIPELAPDYYMKEMQPPPYSPTLNPTHFFSSPLFSPQLGMLGASPHTVIPTSFRLQMKARRKDEKKKCRKVYGIENRHFWCTQCKWKKACTRFTTGNKIISNGFI